MILDGAHGTLIQSRKLTEADYRGTQFAGHGKDLRLNGDLLNITQPAIIEDIHLQYLEAGCDIIETNTFTSNAISQSEYGLQDHVAEMNRAAVGCARRAIAQ
jgi:5-methyltetrahydrofolate--homocysteine methyltransferase